MALTRARPIFGSASAQAETRAVIDGVLAGDRPHRDMVADALAMRAEMALHKPPKGPLDAKLAPGGLVDLEFAVHVVQLTRRASAGAASRRGDRGVAGAWPCAAGLARRA